MAETTTKKTVNEMEQMVEVRLPKAQKGEPNFMFVGVNGQFFKVKRGEKVSVPKPVANIIEESMDAEEKADAFLSSLTK